MRSKNPTYEYLKKSVFYQVYPTSFYDGNGDGVGDLSGVVSKLAYIKDLGADGIWLNPCFLSEFRDGGYDVVDYYKIDPRFGTDGDLGRLFEEADKLGLKILLDLVPGHTSEKCEWFLQSKKAGKNPYSDYYIWTDNVFNDGAGLRTVNGVCERDGNYAVNFFAMQPALNFGFAEVRRPWQKLWTDPSFEAIHSEIIRIMEHYLSRGAAGFRVDMASSLIKYDADGAKNAELWQMLIGRVKQKYPRAIFVSEWSQPEMSVGRAGFDIDFLIHVRGEAYNSLFRAEAEHGAWGAAGAPSYFRAGSPAGLGTFFDGFFHEAAGLNDNGFIGIPTGNHDIERLSAGRTADEMKTAFAFLLTLPSVPFIYYGDEIGMRHLPVPNKDGGYSRTGSRTPMQWTDGKRAGFSTAKPKEFYLPVENDPLVNVRAQENDGGSLLSCVKKLIQIRKGEPALWADAEIKILTKYMETPFLYERTDGKGKLVIALNAKGGKARRAFPCKGTVLAKNNCRVEAGELCFDGCGFLIFKAGEKQ
ncbi:MAG: glycosylase [Clostridiales bacterium]|jgi:maltose alpha-D-glucosyltransferase/alpha-amylase|nr:glycosylase [Clostridiales bacterium]